MASLATGRGVQTWGRTVGRRGETRAFLRLPAWRDGQTWTYELHRAGKQGFTGRLTYTARRLPDGAWRVEGVSDYPEGRSLRERLEVTGEPVRCRDAFFERRNAAGLLRYEARQADDGSLWVRTETDAGQREATFDARQGPVYLSNQFDLLLHGLAVEAGGPWTARLLVESGKVLPFEVRLLAREAPLTIEGETLPATLVTIKIANNPLLKALAPPAQYWFHPKDQTMLLRLVHGETTLTLTDAT